MKVALCTIALCLCFEQRSAANSGRQRGLVSITLEGVVFTADRSGKEVLPLEESSATPCPARVSSFSRWRLMNDPPASNEDPLRRGCVEAGISILSA